jgi:hypothetical protein
MKGILALLMAALVPAAAFGQCANGSCATSGSYVTVIENGRAVQYRIVQPNQIVTAPVAQQAASANTLRQPNGHTHTCPKCGDTWDHDKNPTHNCKQCGTFQNVVDQPSRMVQVRSAALAPVSPAVPVKRVGQYVQPGEEVPAVASAPVPAQRIGVNDAPCPCENCPGVLVRSAPVPAYAVVPAGPPVQAESIREWRFAQERPRPVLRVIRYGVLRGGVFRRGC